MKSGIYQILNTVNGKKYIGSSKDVVKRLGGHKNTLKKGTHSNSHLQSAFKKYGLDNFVYSVLEVCDEQVLIEREQWHIDTSGVKNLYNILPRAYSLVGRKINEEQIKKFAYFWQGKKRPPMTDEARRNMSEAHKGIPSKFRKHRPTLSCLICEKHFTVRPHKLTDGKGKFCSVECKNVSLRGRTLSPRTQFQKGFAPWNKGTKGLQVAWNKGIVGGVENF